MLIRTMTSICLLAAAVAQGAPLEVAATRTLNVTMGEQPLVTGDSVTLADFSEATFNTAEDAHGCERVTWLHGGDPDTCAFYREVGQHEDRIEITWHITYGPYQFGEELPGHTYNENDANYDLRIPAEAIEGAAYTARVGSPIKPRQREGTLGADDDGVLLDRLLFITFTRDGESVTFDLNPPGAHSMGHYSLWYERWIQLVREGDHYVIRARFRRVNWGDTRWFKYIITEGAPDYETLHPRAKRGFAPNLYPSHMIDARRNPHEDYMQLDASVYSEARGLGWVTKTDTLALTHNPDRSGLESQQLHGQGAHVLRVNAPDGLYLVSVLIGGTKASGPMDVSANAELRLSDHVTQAGRYSAQTFPAWVDDGHVAITFDGQSWLLCGLSLTPLLSPWEDYLFKRDWYLDATRHTAWYEEVENLSPVDPIEQAPVSDNPLASTWHGHITTWCGANDGSRAGLDTQQGAAYRAAELASGGFDWISINGAHMRFNHHAYARNRLIKRNSRRAVRQAHQRGMNVYEHFDFNWVMYSGYPEMLEVLEEDPSALQRHKNPLLISTAFCLNSPAFRERFREYVVDFQRATNVDGMMIDEINWIRPAYCGCDNCRRKFEEDTGIYIDDFGRATGGDTPEGIALIKWRGNVVHEVNNMLRAARREARSDSITLSYTSIYLSRPNGRNYQLDEQWSVDYFGDEFHPDLVLQNWRNMFARTKNRRAVADSWNLGGTWILPKFRVTHDRMLYAWAISRMNRANLWVRADDYAHSKQLNDWPDRMDDANSTPLSDVAVLLSDATRDLNSDYTYYHYGYQGWLQTLAEENVQYDVLLERDLEAGKAQQYPVLLLENIASMSDAQVERVRAFVADGGRVIASYETGFYDDKGYRRDAPGLAEAMNVRFGDVVDGGATVRLKSELAAGAGVESFDTPSPHRMVELRDPARSQVLATIDGAPAVVRTAHGDGAFYWLAGRFCDHNFEKRAVSSRNQTTLAERVQYETHFNPDVNRFVRALVDRALGDDRQTTADVPHGVIYTAYRESNNIVLHLLNAQGKPRLSHGDTYPAPDDVPQPTVEGALEFEITTDLPLTQGAASSPEVDGKTAVHVDKIGSGRYRVVIPEGALTNYLLVRLTR